MVQSKSLIGHGFLLLVACYFSNEIYFRVPIVLFAPALDVIENAHSVKRSTVMVAYSSILVKFSALLLLFYNAFLSHFHPVFRFHHHLLFFMLLSYFQPMYSTFV